MKTSFCNKLFLCAAALALNLTATQSAEAAAFTPTGSLGGTRAGHSATLLSNGRVLVTGGFNGTVRLATSQSYDPATGTWTATGAMATGRTTHTATLLSIGKVLATGGHIASANSTATCELYDPVAGTWAATGTMATPRGNHTATSLLNGKSLAAGGYNRNTGVAVSATELYNPATGTWTTTGLLAAARNFHTATLLLNGKVLVAGGAPDALQYASLASVELYDPVTGTWTETGSMITARQAHTATLLPDGRVLVAGGFKEGYFMYNSELYDPATGTWSATGPLGVARGVHTATLLPDGTVLAVGGNHNSFSEPLATISSAELYNPASGMWTATGALNAPHTTHTATLLPSGKTLIAAGYNANTGLQLSSAELYGSAAGEITLVNLSRRAGGAFQFAFTGAANGTNTVLAATNPALPSSNWAVLGVAPEFAPGLFFFSNPQAANSPQRFYRIRSP